MIQITDVRSLRARIGQELAVSGWLEITQARIDQFADATGDRQWIHVDQEAAARGPFGTTVAHGYLTLSLLPAVVFELLPLEATAIAPARRTSTVASTRRSMPWRAVSGVTPS